MSKSYCFKLPDDIQKKAVYYAGIGKSTGAKIQFSILVADLLSNFIINAEKICRENKLPLYDSGPKQGETINGKNTI